MIASRLASHKLIGRAKKSNSERKSGERKKKGKKEAKEKRVQSVIYGVYIAEKAKRKRQEKEWLKVPSATAFRAVSDPMFENFALDATPPRQTKKTQFLFEKTSKKRSLRSLAALRAQKVTSPAERRAGQIATRFNPSIEALSLMYRHCLECILMTCLRCALFLPFLLPFVSQCHLFRSLCFCYFSFVFAFVFTLFLLVSPSMPSMPLMPALSVGAVLLFLCGDGATAGAVAQR